MRAQEEDFQLSSTTATASEAENEMRKLAMDPSEVSKIIPEKTASKKRKRRYIGDMASSDFSTPEKRRKNLQKVKQTVAKQRKRIHSLQMTVRRLRLRITSLESLLKHLKEKSLISESAESIIKASVSGPAVDIFERLLKGPSAQKYNPSLRSFALTLSFYSAKAYNFVRRTFNRTLPHLGTISKWYSSVDGSPGFTKEALIALTLKQKESSKPLLCNLVMDEMSIRRQVEWTGQKFTGYVDIGTAIDEDTLPEAREALVFMLFVKLPVGYFLLNGLSASTKAGLVNKCLEFIHESGVTITSLTFDGAPVNITMAEKLGADFTDPLNLKTSFKHPITNSDIYIFLDACHMIKLVRNCMASQTGLKDINKKEIKWSYVTNLVDKQNVEGLHAATKIRIRHLQWAREKMKVRLATQTISRSVSDAITFLRDDLKSPEFQDSEATSEFLLKFNNLFDIFNSRNRHVKYEFKKPLSLQTALKFFEYINEVKEYIIGITFKRQTNN
ncbi:hypothetical protein NQ317_015416 [Molorchus minor]|uniref:DNA transposase THAP9 n=1 Tax=Molorchus minor TaxID=1323400 RepID=A0ABQ9IQC4_9CUCU|nr:hypothetical protein NQ317_015416 [Molorchus minor]